MEAWLLSQGFALYEEVFLPLPPLLVQPLAWLFQLTGPSSVAARYLEVAYAVLGLAAIACLGRAIWSAEVGWLAAIILSLSPGYFLLSRFSLGNVPALALGLVSLYFGWRYFAGGRRRWLILAGLMASISLLIKPLIGSGPVLLIGLVIARHRPWRRIGDPESGQHRSASLNMFIADGVVLAMAGSGPILLAAFFYNASAMFEQVVKFRAQLNQAQTTTIFFNLAQVWHFLNANIGLSLLCLAGLIWLLISPNRPGRWIVISWLSLTLLLILNYKSLQDHHLVILEPIMALAAALAIVMMIRMWSCPDLKRWRIRGMIGFSLVATIIYCSTLPASGSNAWAGRPRGLALDQDRARWQAVGLLKQLTTVDQAVLSDDLAIPFEAGRRVPPRLSDPSRSVIEVGYLDHKTAIQVAARQAEVIIFWNDRFQKGLPYFAWWVEENYQSSIALGPDRIIYLDKQLPHISVPQQLDFGDQLRLAGYDLVDRPGDQTALHLQLYWRKLAETDIDYKITVRALDQLDQLVAQVDRRLLEDFFPTSKWPVEILFWDALTIDLPSSAVSYLAVGIYDPNTLQLLPVSGTTDNLFILPVSE